MKDKFDLIVKFVKETRSELKKVVWPSRQETIKYTILVLGISLATAIFLGGLDFGLNKVVEIVIN